MSVNSHIKNPLTIIGLFAGLAEGFGACVLPKLMPEIQFIFVWFVIVFPFVLITLFFITLNWNHKVLYAPSDYKDETNFLKSYIKGQASPEEKLQKLSEEINLSEEDNPNNDGMQNLAMSEPKKPIGLAEYTLLEEIALSKLFKEHPGHYVRNAPVVTPQGRYVFDAIKSNKNGDPVFIEGKLIRSFGHLRNTFKKLAPKLLDVVSDFKTDLLFVVITDIDVNEYSAIERIIESYFAGTKINVIVTIFGINELRQEIKNIS